MRITAYYAMQNIPRDETAALDSKVSFLIKVLRFIASEAGFDVIGRIGLRDRKTGKEYK